MKSLLILFAALPLGATAIYTNPVAWNTAIQSAKVVHENFDSETLIPGLTMVSKSGGVFGVPIGPGYGHVDTAKQAWVDCVGETCDTVFNLNHKPFPFTIIRYDKPIWGLAGDWMINDGNGIEIDAVYENTFSVYIVSDPFSLRFPPSPTVHPGFVGFTTDQSFIQAVIWWDFNFGDTTHYELRDLSVVISNATPEPRSWGLVLAAGVAFFTIWLHKGRRLYCRFPWRSLRPRSPFAV
jgi:hypothetical protein